MWLDGRDGLYIGNGDNCHYDPGQADEGEFLSIPAKLSDGAGLTDLCVVARCAAKTCELSLNWIEFQP
jgi:hypothetical protein